MAITNGDFETGDTTGWTVYTKTGCTVTVKEAAKKTGTYGCELYSQPGSGGISRISQSINVTDCSSLEFYFNVAAYTMGDHPDSKIYLTAYIGATEMINATYTSGSLPPSGWQYVTCDVSGLSGAQTLQIQVKAQDYVG